MIRLYRLVLLVALLIPGLVAADSSQKTKKDNSAAVAAVTKVSDSAQAVFRKAVATSNVDQLLSFFVDTAGVVMPDKNSLQGLDNIRKRAPLLMRIVGGGTMVMERTSMRVQEDGLFARDAGTFAVTRKLDNGGTWRFDGLYTLFWKKTDDGPWKLDRAFLAENPRPERGK